MRRIIGVVAVAVVLAGCGSGTSPDAASSERTTVPPTTESTLPPSSTTTAAPETTTTVPVDYGKQYLTLVAPPNCELDRWKALSNELDAGGTPAWADIQSRAQPQMRKLAEVNTAFYEGLLRSEWPPDVQPEIATLAAEVSTEAQYWAAAAGASDQAAFVAVAANAPEPANTAAVVRAKLGLDSNVLDDVDYCATSGI